MNELRVEKALRAADETRVLRLGAGVIEECGGVFREVFPGRQAIIIADRNTYDVAGEKVRAIFEREGIPVCETHVFDPSGLYAEFGYVHRIDALLDGNDAIPVAVGSGTINDLVKLSSHRNGRRYLCVATAASMDGYTAYGASITSEGSKQTFDCPAPLAVVADTTVIAAAPPEMTASGYADLSAKLTAGADWILADALGIETLDRDVFAIVQDGIHEALSDPRGVISGSALKITPLVEGLMLGGFAMQAARTSRPASGAEHQFSHLWDMEHHKFNGRSPSHGFKVSIGTLASTAMYEMLLRMDPDDIDIERAVRQWPSLEDQQKTAFDMFRGTDFPSLAAQELEAKYSTPEELRLQLNALKTNWYTIKKDLSSQLLSFEELCRRLSTVGAPVFPTDIGITTERMRSSFLRAQQIRRRFTILDLAVRLGRLDQWIDGIFGMNGIWLAASRAA